MFREKAVKKAGTGIRIGLLICLVAICVVGGRGRQPSEEYREKVMELVAGSEEREDATQLLDDIRDYVYTQLEWACSERYHPDVREQIFGTDKMWEERLYELCLPETIESAGYCGGTAYVLSAIYNLLGYKSCTLDMVVLDTEEKVVNSHVVTLVFTEGEWLVEDPSFNLTFMKDGKHISIQGLVR